MNILASWAAHQAAATPGLAIGISAGVRADSLDGFAIWALVSGACFLAVASPRSRWRVLFTRRTAFPGRALFPRSAQFPRPAQFPGPALFPGRDRVTARGAHRSPPRWALAGPPRAEAHRMGPRHAAPGRSPGWGHLSVRTGRMIWRRRVAFLLPSAFSRSRASSQSPYSA
jgi:hypothetical protein